MAKNALLDEYNSVKEYVKENSQGQNKVTLTMNTLQSKFGLSNYNARSIMIRLRVDPEIRTVLKHYRSRFKPKDCIYDTDLRNKIEDSKVVGQFDFDQEELDIINKKLADYLNPKDLQCYSTLMFLCEKARTSLLHKEWGNPKMEESARLLAISLPDISMYYNILVEKHLMVQSPYTRLYKFTLKDSEYENAMEDISEQSTNPEFVAQAQVNNTILDNEFIDLKASSKLQASVRSLSTVTARLTSITENQIKLISQLAIEEKTIKAQKAALARLSENYNELSENHYNLQQEFTAKSEELKKTDQFLSDYMKYVDNKLINLSSYISSALDAYFKLPSIKKSDFTVSNKSKMEILDMIIAYQKEIKSYKKGKTE